MDLRTSAAVNWEHIIPANEAMARHPDCRLKVTTRNYQRNLKATESSEIAVITDHFNGGQPSELTGDRTAQNARPYRYGRDSRFCHIGPFSQLLHDIARDVRSSLVGAPVGKKYYIVNSQETHWVTVVYEIKSASTSPQHITNSARIRVSNQLHFDFDAMNENSTSVSSSSATSARNHASNGLHFDFDAMQKKATSVTSPSATSALTHLFLSLSPSPASK